MKRDPLSNHFLQPSENVTPPSLTLSSLPPMRKRILMISYSQKCPTLKDSRMFMAQMCRRGYEVFTG